MPIKNNVTGDNDGGDFSQHNVRIDEALSGASVKKLGAVLRARAEPAIEQVLLITMVPE